MAQSLDNLSRTWSDSGTTFTAIKYDVTDSASAAGSLLMDLQVGGVSKFQVAKNGNPRIDGNGYDWVLDANAIPNTLAFSANGVASWVGMVDAGLKLGGNIQFGVTLGATTDLILARDAADTLAQRRTTNPQTFRIYNTYTDASNYERAKIAWESNVLVIGTEKLGSGSNRGLNLSWDGGNGRIDFITSASNTSGTRIYTPGNGKLAIITSSNGAGTLAFGLATSSFGQIKGVATTLQARLADDSAFTNIQGKLTTETAYTAGAPTATGYIVLYDSTGTAYKVPAEAL